MVFATDTEEDLHRWIKSFHCGTSIQVQPVSTVEEIRITDLDMQKRWTSLDKSIPPEVNYTHTGIIIMTSHDHDLHISTRVNLYIAG